MAIPPRVADAMDGAQRWAIACTREALADYGYPERPLNTERTAVILGNAMAGEKHYLTAMRAYFPEYARELDESATFAALPAAVRRDITREWHARVGDRLPPITEDSMPGELANCLAGRIANLYNFHGPNFVCDAACASAMAAIHAAAEGLIEHDFDVAVTGGIDRNMGASDLREVLQDRRALGDRVAAIRRGRGRLRDGGRRGDLPYEAPGRCRARRRQDLRGAARRSAGRATAKGRASRRPTPSGRRSRSSAPGRMPACRRPRRR